MNTTTLYNTIVIFIPRKEKIIIDNLLNILVRPTLGKASQIVLWHMINFVICLNYIKFHVAIEIENTDWTKCQRDVNVFLWKHVLDTILSTHIETVWVYVHHSYISFIKDFKTRLYKKILLLTNWLIILFSYLLNVLTKYQTDLSHFLKRYYHW